MRKRMRRIVLASCIGLFFTGAMAQELNELEIHYINVGQGGATLIIGPDGTTIMYDFGNVPGRRDIVPYLSSIGISPGDTIDFTIVSHRDRDHYYGFRDVVRAGYDVGTANYDSGSRKTSSTIRRQWTSEAENTSAGAVQPIPVGLRIQLGDGAEAIVLAANGKILGQQRRIRVENENDRSVSLLVTYRDFQFILDGDLGSGPEGCTSHQTSQLNVQTAAASAAIREGFLREELGVDVMHVAHHGSESSTSAAYMNLVRPEVAIISVGIDQAETYRHPREDVVEAVLLGDSNGQRPSCVTAPPVVAVYQTEDGWPGRPSSSGRMTDVGQSIGDIIITTDGFEYWVYGTNRVHCRKLQGDQEQCSAKEAQSTEEPVGRFMVDGPQ